MSAQDEKRKLAILEKKRKDMMDQFAAQKNELVNETNKNRTGSDRFASASDGVDEQLKKSTYGLVQLSDFKVGPLPRLSPRATDRARNAEEEKKKKKKKKEGKVKLSFAFDDGEEDESTSKKGTKAGGDDDEEGTGDEEPPTRSDRPSKKAKLGKNPSIDTSFLPDREREESERKVRDELRREWLTKQETMKAEDIEITYSYWDGSGHRKVVTCKKGDTIAQFLDKCRLQFPELRAVSVDNLMYIKEDLIIPHHYTFYDFIVNRYRGKSGPMFNFDVHEDVRLISDASVEKDESHAGKVVERSWYNRSKHIFPASRWEVFNPEVKRDRYTIHGE
ncbi:BQ5605_C004g02764 [Microbotryum silenes-dioicae]|uniref:BQ5605_C004g02764 protein n=1 Tax=Microbotryum silenes-dioicae TaxID=796604 RepID=A0A2X0N2S9_9BASI|nr:BQ5605_C004g02764 [Microbotryum silenes-dioicae]